MDKKNRINIDIDELSALAMLSFTEDEKKVLEAEMRAFLELASKLEAIDVNKCELTDSENGENVLRDDIAEIFCSTEEMLGGAKTKEYGYITVPRVVEG